jgi:Glu-tRNA(Gln) amidotransferase subunit E-like FAD-binding protein
VGVFNSPDEAYALAGISFVELPDDALRKIKKRDRETIEFFSKLGVELVEHTKRNA